MRFFQISKGFDRFVGIDWSGAQNEYNKGIQVAEARRGKAGPKLIASPRHRGWSRQAVMDYLLDLKKQGRHVLAGIDFAFSHPFGDRGYYPDSENSPQDPESLWGLIDEVNDGKDYLYGGGIWAHTEWSRYYNAPESRGGKGDLYEPRRRRMTEEIAASINNRTPSSTFNCVGPGGVGTGSLAGMRLLHHLKSDASIWPFTNHPRSAVEGSLTLVEIYPALYFAMAEVKDNFKRDQPLDALNHGLKFFKTRRRRGITKNLPDNDDLDAIVSAAALRHIHDPDKVFPIDPEYREAAKQEGWIFGAGHAGT